MIDGLDFIGVEKVKILAFDSSNQPLTVAVINDQTILAEKIINIKRNHSIQLMPAIDEVLKEAKIKIKDIERIAVAKGPGSYTGLRIAVATAKSLAWARKIDLVAVSSLKVLAANSLEKKQPLIVPLFDARRENIYTGLYQRNEKGELILLEEDTHVSASQWASFLAEKYPKHSFLLVGMDAEKFYPYFKEKLADKVEKADRSQNLPRASALAFLGQAEKVVDTHQFIPSYLKRTEAEENWLEEHPEFKGGSLVEKI
ncbi:MAG: tRNA (adenosine(37)-N6)-threonylcarbamoyltransferase complex dimerization subunit type 1 TsaB [Atopostipes suicloacalis]|nr:tRNA (adenosine(37)-N6)-threonylcarbamoyltransferase complex dimerization subunit type 1 TsaB [Atopostipes suicloacalis]